MFLYPPAIDPIRFANRCRPDRASVPTPRPLGQGSVD